MPTIVIAYHSGNHHTEAVALEVAKGVESAGVDVIVHNVENPVERLWSDLAAADAIIFGSPTYMGSVSAAFKKFIDNTGKPWYTQQWKDKLAAGFTNSGNPSGDKCATLNTLYTMACQHGMVWVSTGILPSKYTKDGKNLNRLAGYTGLMTESDDAPADVTPPQEDRETARVFGARVAQLTKRWVAGKAAE